MLGRLSTASHPSATRVHHLRNRYIVGEAQAHLPTAATIDRRSAGENGLAM